MEGFLSNITGRERGIVPIETNVFLRSLEMAFDLYRLHAVFLLRMVNLNIKALENFRSVFINQKYW
jgi:hypothetical protein